MKTLIKERIENLLLHVNPDNIADDHLPLLDEYEAALSINKRGYSIHYQRDVNESSVEVLWRYLSLNG